MMNIETFEVEIEHEGERLDKYLSMIFDEAASARGLTPQSRSFFQKLIKDGQVLVNGEVELQRGKKLHPGDIFSFNGEEAQIQA